MESTLPSGHLYDHVRDFGIGVLVLLPVIAFAGFCFWEGL